MLNRTKWEKRKKFLLQIKYLSSENCWIFRNKYFTSYTFSYLLLLHSCYNQHFKIDIDEERKSSNLTRHKIMLSLFFYRNVSCLLWRHKNEMKIMRPMLCEFLAHYDCMDCIGSKFNYLLSVKLSMSLYTGA